MLKHRYGIKLSSSTPDAATLKLLRKFFPERSLAELREGIQRHDYLYCSHAKTYPEDAMRQIAMLLREFDRAGVETELYEEHQDASGSWQTRPLSREVWKNLMQRGRTTARQVLEDMERETEGWISPEARSIIDQELAEMWDET